MIYLDSAATSLQKPPEVAQAVLEALKTMASPGRGGHCPARLAADTAFACRCAAAELFGLDNPERVVITFNATHSLNLAIKSLVKPGDEVVISGYEHNAVTRPLAALQCRIKLAGGPLFRPAEMVEAFKNQLSDKTACVICTHVSNVFGYVLPVEEIANMCTEKGIPFILDASQSAGCIPICPDLLRCAFTAMPGHKGLYGPQGTGLLLCGEGWIPNPLMEGGTGSWSARRDMPEFLPDRLESGTHNMPGIAGLLAGIRFVTEMGEDRILAHERELLHLMVEELRQIPGLVLYCDQGLRFQTGVLSMRMKGVDSEELGEKLSRAGFALRAGLHCAPAAHKTVGTLKGGTLRASVSAFNTVSEVAGFAEAMRRIAG